MTIQEAEKKILDTYKGYVVEKIVDFNDKFYVAQAYPENANLATYIDPFLKVNKKTGVISDFSPLADPDRFEQLFDDDYDEEEATIEHASDFIDDISKEWLLISKEHNVF